MTLAISKELDFLAHLILATKQGLQQKVVFEGREQGTGNREQRTGNREQVRNTGILA